MKSISITPKYIEQRYDIYIAGDTFEQFQQYITTARAEFNTEPRVVASDDGLGLCFYREVPLTPEAEAALRSIQDTIHFEQANSEWSNA
jgi:hypothetical protein